MAAQESVAMTPTSDMPLDDIIRDLEARRDKAREAMLQFVVESIKRGHLKFGHTDFVYNDDDPGIYAQLSDADAFGNDYDEACRSREEYIRQRMELGIELDDADDTLRRALDLRDALEGEA